jgi:outer membrane lipase/esterase
MKISTIVLIIAGLIPRVGAAQNQPNLETLPDQNYVQSSMSSAIQTACMPINKLGAPPESPTGMLANSCKTMVNTAFAAQGGVLQPNAPSWGLSVNQTNAALQQVNGGAVIAAPQNQNAQVQTTLSARLSALRAGAGGLSVGDLGQPASLQYASLQVAQAPGTPGTPPPLASPWGFFFNGLGNFGSKDLTSYSDSYSFGGGGFSSGVDYRFSPAFVAGIGFAYLHVNTDYDTNALSAPGQFLNSNNYTGSAYATFNATDALYFDGILSIGGTNYDSRRHIIIPSNTSQQGIDAFESGSFGGRNYLASIGGGYALPFGAWTLTPTLRFDANRIQSTAFDETESGPIPGGLPLAYGSSGQNAFLSALGTRVNYAISTDFGVVIPQARAEWVHQYNNGRTAIDARYLNDPTGLSVFTVLGDQVGRNYAVLSASVVAQLAGDIAAYVDYTGTAGLQNIRFNAFLVGVRMGF